MLQNKTSLCRNWHNLKLLMMNVLLRLMDVCLAASLLARSPWKHSIPVHMVLTYIFDKSLCLKFSWTSGSILELNPSSASDYQCISRVFTVSSDALLPTIMRNPCQHHCLKGSLIWIIRLIRLNKRKHQYSQSKNTFIYITWITSADKNHGRLVLAEHLRVTALTRDQFRLPGDHEPKVPELFFMIM